MSETSGRPLAWLVVDQDGNPIEENNHLVGTVADVERLRAEACVEERGESVMAVYAAPGLPVPEAGGEPPLCVKCGTRRCSTVYRCPDCDLAAPSPSPGGEPVAATRVGLPWGKELIMCPSCKAELMIRDQPPRYLRVPAPSPSPGLTDELAGGIVKAFVRLPKCDHMIDARDKRCPDCLRAALAAHRGGR